MATSIKALRANNQKALYEIQLSTARQQHEAIGALIESGDFDAARIKCGDLELTLGKLNTTANALADALA